MRRDYGFMKTDNRLILKDSIGAPGKTRTCDLLIRSQTLYPTELRARDKTLLLYRRPYDSATLNFITPGITSNYTCLS